MEPHAPPAPRREPSPARARQPSNALLEWKLLNTQLQCVEQSSLPYQKQVVSLQLITILWMCTEAAVAIFAALRAHSVALLGFGADSGIELGSAFVVFLRFRKIARVNEQKAARINGLAKGVERTCTNIAIDDAKCGQRQARRKSGSVGACFCCHRYRPGPPHSMGAKWQIVRRRQGRSQN